MNVIASANVGLEIIVHSCPGACEGNVTCKSGYIVITYTLPLGAV
jgi:hypothetical protein